LDDVALLAHLQSLTGDLAGGDAGSEALHDLRRQLAASLRAHRPAPEIASSGRLSAEKETELRLAIAESSRLSSAESSFVRRNVPLTSPVLSQQTSAKDFAGQTPSKIFGPFKDTLGNPVWFDLFLVGPTLQISFAGSPEVVLVLPSTHISPGSLHLHVGAGSIWILAQALTLTAPAGSYVGLRIEEATIDLSAAGSLTANKLTLPASAACHIIMVPDNSEIPAPPARPGIDAADDDVQRPASAELHITASGVTELRAEPASLKVFGNKVKLVRSSVAPSFESSIERILIPFTPDLSEATLTAQTTLCTLGGQGKIQQGGWCPALSKAKPDQLGDAGSGGLFMLSVAGDLKESNPGLERGPIRLGPSVLFADRGIVGIISLQAENRAATYINSLWEHSSFHLTTDEPFTFLFLSSRSGIELLQLRGTLNATLSGPKKADGTSLPLRFHGAAFSIWQNTAGIWMSGSASNQVQGERTALALSNGLFTLSQAEQMNWFGQLGPSSSAFGGSIQLRFGIYQLLPMLPDPYVANFSSDFKADSPRGSLILEIEWGPGSPQFRTTVLSPKRKDGSPEILPPPILTPLPDSESERLKTGFQTFLRAQPWLAVARPAYETRSLRLLDVSSNADQLGIDLSYPPANDQPIEIQGIDVVSYAGAADVLMLPQMQWEPVQVVQNPNVGTLPPYLASPDDGGPSLFGGSTVRLTPVAPLPLALAVVDAHNETGERASAFFTLPFGIRALATLDPRNSPPDLRASIQIFRKQFDDSFCSATMVRLTAAPPRLRIRRNADGYKIEHTPPFMPGMAVQTIRAQDAGRTPIIYPPSPVIPPKPPSVQPPPFSVLTPIDQDFNGTFAVSPSDASPGVPIEGIDLSGYGASCFSNWNDDTDDDVPKITNVRFEVLIGRTRFEVLQMKSVLLPCHAKVIRTITLERLASGNVNRWDSGWQALTDGLFEPSVKGIVWHTGAVRGFYNIRQIRDTAGTISVKGAELEAVYFDTDVELEHLLKGAINGKRVPSLGQLGFVQRIPFKTDPGGAPKAVIVEPFKADQLEELLKGYAPVGGPLDCILDVGGSGQQMRLSGVYFSHAGGANFAAACYGSLTVPRNEQWSTVQIVSDNEVHAVDAGKGVPLVRLGGTRSNPPSGNYKIADPENLVTPTTAVEYGLQLTTGTNRLLFRRPEIPEGGTQILGSASAVVADPYALVGVGGLFPPVQRCLHLNLASYALDITGGVFRWNPGAGPFNFTIPELGGSLQRYLIKSGPFDLYTNYASTAVHLATNQGTPWGVNIPQVPVALNINTPFPMSDILQVVNDLGTFDGGLAGNKPKVEFGSVLDTAKEVITALKQFAPDTPPITIDLSAPRVDDPALRLLVAVRFPIAHPDGSAIDIGIGKFRGEIGVGNEVHLTASKFGGRIFFTVGGELQQPLLPKIAYVGGSMKLEISIDESGSPAVRLETSAVASIGGDLIPGLVALEGSASYGAFLDTAQNPFVPGVQLGLEARAKLLSGLLGVRFRADAAVGMMPEGGGAVPGLPRTILIQGQVHAMGSVVAAWALEEDFDKTLRFEKEVPGLVAGAFLVSTGLVPLPV